MFAVCPACNGADGISDIEGKVTRVGASERGQRASFNRGRDAGGRTALVVFGCRNARGLPHRIDIVEVDDIIERLAWAAIFTPGVTEILSVTREAGRAIRQREPRRGDGRKLGS